MSAENDDAAVVEQREIDVCPECDSSHINHRIPGHAMNRIPDNGHEYHCPTCGANFDEPASRKRHTTPKLQGSVATLAKMDPDEWPPRRDVR